MEKSLTPDQYHEFVINYIINKLGIPKKIYNCSFCEETENKGLGIVLECTKCGKGMNGKN